MPEVLGAMTATELRTSTETRPWNPYLDEWTRLHGDTHDWMGRELSRTQVGDIQARAKETINRHAHRELCIAKYAFAVPSEQALGAIAALGPVVEMGAGTGYWARCLRERDVDVVAYDELGEDWARWFQPRRMDEHQGWPVVLTAEGSPEPWTEVLKGGPADLARHVDRALLLVWPYMDSMAADSLRAYPGGHVAYVGEGNGGCTADDEFFRLLDAGWEEVESFPVPQWDGIHDWLTVYRRKEAS